MSDSTDSLIGLLTFYEKANLALRLALLIALLWPFSVIGTAMMLAPATAQTVVPIVDLIPLAAIFLLILGAPFGMLVLLRDPAAKRGLTWLAGLIGVELTIGVYFSTIPVSKDIGLVPLLILTAFAILFLRIGGIAGFVTKVLVFLVVGITLVFLLGGRKPFEKRLENALSRSSAGPITKQVSSVPAPVLHFREPPPPRHLEEPTDVCQDAAAQTVRRVSSGMVITGYADDCFGPVVRLPDDLASGMCVEPYPIPGPNEHVPGWTVAFQTLRSDPTTGTWIVVRTTRSIHWTNLPEDDIHLYWNSFPVGIRVKGAHAPGSGVIFVSPASACVAAPNSPNPNGSTSASSVPSASAPMTSGPVAATKDVDVFHFGFWPCRRAAAATFCMGFLENESSQEVFEGVLPSDVKDDLGNDYAFETFTINSFPCFGRRGGCWPSIGAKDSQDIKFQVDGVVPEATSLVLFIHLTTHGSPFPLPPGFNNTQAQDFTVTIPIEEAR
jgi:hypothetical protein